MKKTFIAFSIYCAFLFQLNAQVSLTASADSVVSINETITLNYSVNANPSNFTPPDFSTFRMLYGPTTSVSSNITITNGRTSKSDSKTFSYVLQPKKAGTFTIGKASIVVDSIIYYSNPVTIEVVESIKGKITIQDSTFVRVILNRQSIYQGENVLATIKIFTVEELTGVTKSIPPNFKGFWGEEIESAIAKNNREKVNGTLYHTFVIYQKVLSPYVNGKIIIEPCEVECLIQRPIARNNKFDDFFGPLVKQELKIRSLSTNLNVLPLPIDAPESFLGGVGKNFGLKASVNKANVKCNDRLYLQVRISGNGNLMVLDKLKIMLDSSIIISGPKPVKFNNSISVDSMDTIVYKYVIIPQKVGNYTIPSIQFTYFDLETKDYKTLSTQEIKINVNPSQVSKGVTRMAQGNKLINNSFGAVIAFDVSGSMIAQDFEPNRLEASKTAMTEFIKHNEFNSVGMVLFASNSYLLGPLTTNFNKLAGLISKIDTGMVKDGTAIGIGLATAINQIKDVPIKHKCIILLTDGVNNTGELDPISSSKIAQTLGIRIYTIGIGGKDSALFPIKTPQGIVYQKFPIEIGEESLKTMSSITHGKYFRAYSKQDLAIFLNEIYAIEKSKAEHPDSMSNGDYNNVSETSDTNSDQSNQAISVKVANRVLNAVEINEKLVNEKFKKESKHKP